MNIDEAVTALDVIDLPFDPEVAHAKADEILLAAVAPEVRVAYQRTIERTGRWWFA